MQTTIPSVDRLVRGWRSYLILALLCSALFLPGLTSLPPTDRDESRFAQASKQMLETGNYVDIRFQDVPRYKKPIGIYWLQAGAASLAGEPLADAIWPYRLPSFAGALLAVLLTFHFGSRWFDRRTALLAAALLAGCLLLVVESHLAKTDAMLLAAVTAMQGLLGRIYLQLRAGEKPGFGLAMGFWAVCGLGILLKGPVPPLLALLTVLVLSVADRDLRCWRALRPLPGLILVAAIVLPWLVAISTASHGAFLRTAVGSDLIPKLIGGQESHGAPPGYYLLLFPALFWPGSLFALWADWPSWRQRAVPTVRFCLAWLIPAWLLFEAVPTKLPHYILPTFPAIALLTAHALGQAPEWLGYSRRGLLKWLRWLPVGLWGLVGLLLGGGLTVLPYLLNHRIDPAGLLALAGSLGLCFWVSRRWRQGRLPEAAAGAVLCGLLVLAPALGSVLPGLDGPWLSRAAQQAVARYAKVPAPVVASVGYVEPSLVFLLGTATRLTDPTGAAASLSEHPGSFALIEQKQVAAFQAAVTAAGQAVEPLESIRGYNYSKGKWLTLELFRSVPGAAGG